MVLLIHRPGSLPISDALFNELSEVSRSRCAPQMQERYSRSSQHPRRARRRWSSRRTSIRDTHKLWLFTARSTHTRRLIVIVEHGHYDDMRVLPPNSIFNHSVIVWRVDFPYQSPVAVRREVRSWAKLDNEKFRAAIINSELYSEEKPVSLSQFVDLYLSVLTSLADEFAPVKRVTFRRKRLAVWVDTECMELRRRSRMLERRFRRSNLPSKKLECV